MSIRLKLLREEKNITKTDLANKLDVTFRTITNWEKKQGTVPSLETAKRISKALHVPLIDVYNCFFNDPDLEAELNPGFKFHDHTQDIIDAFSKPAKAFQLFKYINDSRLTGEGFLIYKHRLFRFSHIILHEKDYPEGDIDEAIRHMMWPSDGCILQDENLNSIVLSVSTVQSWRLIPSEQTGTTFEIIVNSALFPDMDDEIKNIGSATVYLCAYKYGENTSLPYYQTAPLIVEKNIDNVLEKYIKTIRIANKLSQQEFADYISRFLGKSIGKQSVAGWEQGSLSPTMKELRVICIIFHIPIEQLLDAYEHNYYVNNGIGETDRCYNLGINHLFSLVRDFGSLSNFLQTLSFVHEILIETETEKLGMLSINNIEHAISDFSTSADEIVLHLNDGNDFQISPENLHQIEPYYIHMSYFFELHALTTDNLPVIICLY